MCKPETWVCAIKITYLTAAFVYLKSWEAFFALTINGNDDEVSGKNVFIRDLPGKFIVDTSVNNFAFLLQKRKTFLEITDWDLLPYWTDEASSDNVSLHSSMDL